MPGDLDRWVHTWIDTEAQFLADLSESGIPGLEVRADGKLRVIRDDRTFLVSLNWDDVSGEDEGEDA